MSGKFHPKLKKTGKQDEERCCLCVACESLKLTTHSSAIRHIKKSLSFWQKAKHFLFLFLWSLFLSSSAALSVASKGASMKQHCSDPVPNMFEGEFFQRHLHIQLDDRLCDTEFWGCIEYQNVEIHKNCTSACVIIA